MKIKTKKKKEKFFFHFIINPKANMQLLALFSTILKMMMKIND